MFKKLASQITNPSVLWQENYAQNWFQENVPDHGKIWMADDCSKILSEDFPGPGDKAEIILTGNFFRRLLESKMWLFEEFRLWTFSERMNEFLSETFKIPRDQLGLIGRKRLPPVKLPDFKSEVNLIYSGKLSLAKNITALLRLTSLMQMEHGLNVTLDIYGDYEDLIDESIGKYEVSSIQETIEKLTKELTWKEVPVFHRNGEWLNTKRPSPHFISLSSSMYEDFGIEAYMASEKGWPCLLSDWGGHGEAGNAFIIPMNLVARSQEPECIQDSKSKILADHLAKGLIPSEGPADDISFIPKRFVLKKELQDSMDTFIRETSPEVLLCVRDQMAEFADTRKGVTFFKNYHAAFGEKQAQEALIINEHELHVGFKFAGVERGYDVISIRDLNNPFYQERFPKYEKVSIIEPGIDVLDVIRNLRQNLKLKSPVALLIVPGKPFEYHDVLSLTDEIRELTI
ncbi:MAG: hypothetical protein ACLGHN_13870 [Bacteriovoracia bacterium]